MKKPLDFINNSLESLKKKASKINMDKLSRWEREYIKNSIEGWEDMKKASEK